MDIVPVDVDDSVDIYPEVEAGVEAVSEVISATVDVDPDDAGASVDV